ncbi:MAG: N4-gp56 family major capsid protein [Dermatophilaceae bacterium]
MALQTYQPTNPVSGNPTNVFNLGKILKSIDVVEVLDKLVKTVPVAANKGETINMQRSVTPDPRVSEVAEGVNPAPRALTYENVTKTFEEFAEVFAVSSRQAELGEEDVLMDSKDRLIDLMKRTREKNAWFTFRAGTNRVFNSLAHAARAQVNGAISLGRIRVAIRTLKNNRAMTIREIANGSVNTSTTPVEAAYLCICHTDCETDIRTLPGVVMLPNIGGAARNLPQLFAQVDNVMFITSPEFEPFFGEGAGSPSSLNLRSAGGTNVDVYPYLIFGKDALGKANLKLGSAALGAVEMTVLDKADKSDPTNQRRLVSCRWWDAPVILQQLHVVRIECGVTENPT